MRHRMIGPALALVLGATALDAQDTVRATVAKDKSPTTARVIGIVPGAGHMYAGETTRGFAYMGGTLGVLALGTMMLAAECFSSLGVEENCHSSGTETVVTAAVLGLWGWSIYDAGRAAHRTNARRRLRVSLIVAPVRSIQARARDSRAVTLGLSVAMR
jgi:hypothetical protein